MALFAAAGVLMSCLPTPSRNESANPNGTLPADQGTSGGAIAGLVLGCVALALLVAYGLYALHIYRVNSRIATVAASFGQGTAAQNQVPF